MSVGIRAMGSTASGERVSVLPQPSSPHAQDLALAQRVVAQDPRARKQLAQRLLVRVRRAAHLLMAGSPDADDAAQHALIEVLRALQAYAGDGSLEDWADRVTARSVVRFARAVRARTGLGDELEPEDRREELSARTLEELLRRLPRTAREALYLRDSLGLELVEVARLMRVSRRALREYLARARESLYVRAAAKDASGEVTGLPASVESWFALRDREGSQLQSEQEQEEQRALEQEPEVRRVLKQLAELAQLLEGGGRASSRDRKLLEGALTAVQVSLSLERASVLPSDDVHEVASAQGSSWVQTISTLLCVLLVVATFVALVYHVPKARPAPGALAAAVDRAPAAPTVQALSIARAAERGAHLERAGEPLGEGTTMREGDVIAAPSRAGCFVLEPRGDVCLGPGSQARIVQLGGTRRIELLRGRAVISIERVAGGAPFGVAVGELHAETSDGVLGVELEAGSVIVRMLRGTARVYTSDEAREVQLTSARSLVYRAQEDDLEVLPQLLEKARRDWDLLAKRSQPVSGGRSSAALSPAAKLDANQAPARDQALERAPGLEGASDPAQDQELAAPAQPPRDAAALAAEARKLSRAQQWSEAANLYQELMHSFPNSPEARAAQVLFGELQLQRLAMPEEALASFDRYLARGGGEYDLRARYGRILALRRLGRVPEEQASVQQFLSLYRATPQARVLLSASEPAELPEP